MALLNADLLLYNF